MTKPLASSQLTKALAILALSLALGWLFDYCFFDKSPGLSFPVYTAALAGGILALSAYFQQPLSRHAFWLLAPLMFFSTMVAVRASELLTLLNIGATLMLLLAITALSFRRSLNSFHVADYLRLPLLPLKFIYPIFHTIAGVIALRGHFQGQPMVRQVIKGIIITVPVVVVFLALFASADLIVQKYVTGIFNLQLDETTIVRLILITLATIGLTGLLSYMFNNPGLGMSEPAGPAESRTIIGKVESSILLGSVNVLFFLFILVQLAYLFGGQTNISAQGFTYAEYARKGFFELLAVGLLAFGLLWAADKYVARDKGLHTLVFRLLSSALIVQVVLVMASAFRRLYLYEQAYGFTTLRLYSHAFTVLLAVIFLLLAYKIIRSASERTFALPAFVSVIAFLAVMNFLNPDAFIARQNIERLEDTGKIDAPYLSSLSDDAVPVIVSSLYKLNTEDRVVVESDLVRREDRGESAPKHWQSWNVSRQATSAIVKP